MPVDRRAPTLYRPLDFAVIRAPMLPVEHYRSLRGRPADELLRAEPLARLALQVASPSLAEAATRAGPVAVHAAVRGKILRYLIRMSTRPTPFGLCASVGLARWSDRTDAAIGDDPRPRRTRPDMGWLLALALEHEADPAVRHSCRVMANTCAFEHEGRIRLTEPALPGRGPVADVSVRASPVVQRALTLARRPVAYAELVDELVTTTPGATREKVDALLDQLWSGGLLLTDLRPPLTADPVRHLVRCLDAAPAAGALPEELAGVVAAAGRVDAGPERDAADALAAVAVRARSLAGKAVGDPVQIDSALPLRSDRIRATVAEDAARAADLLFRLHPAPGGSAMLAAYRAAFVDRYGHDRLVGVAELLDPRFGLGPPSVSGAYVHDHHGSADARRTRDDTLVELACGALRDGRTEVQLDDDLLDALTTWSPRADQLPASVDLSTVVLAADAAAVDRGDYRLMVGPGLGAPAAGRILGRFADLLGSEADAALRRVASAEQDRLPGRIHAELVYLPAALRSANVAIRPAVRDHEIAVGVASGVPPDRVVAVDELAVGVGEGRLRLWWLPHAVEVVVTAGHMLNTRGASEICRFLHDVGRDGVTDLHPFDWGTVTDFPALPRVTSGRIVLAPATWSLRRGGAHPSLRTDGRDRFADALGRWRERWNVPPQVYLAESDNRLLLDLDDSEQCEVLRRELCRDRRAPLTLHEPLPAPSDAWLPGPSGRFLCEIVVPLVQRSDGRAAIPADRVPAAPQSVPPQLRRRPPGSDWLYLKLYCPRGRQDELVAEQVRVVAAELIERGLVDRWFFVRYADPESHVRFRVHGTPAQVSGAVLATVAEWAGRLVADEVCTRWSTDVYEREVERYGGPRGIDVAESIFAVDAVAVADLLAVLRATDPVDPIELLAVTVEDLLAGLGFDDGARARWFAAGPTPSRESGRVYRTRQAGLRRLLARGATTLGPAGEAVAAVLDARRAALAPLTADLRAFADAEELRVPSRDLAADFVHLHCNRLFGDREHERLVLDLLCRTHGGLLAEAKSRGRQPPSASEAHRDATIRRRSTSAGTPSSVRSTAGSAD